MKIGETATFIITLTSQCAKENGFAEPAEVTVTFESKASGAFDYGNGSATVMKWAEPTGKEFSKVYDTRYMRGDFDSVCRDLMYDYFGSNIDEIDRIDIEQRFRLRVYDYSGKQIKQKTFSAFGWHDAERKEIDLLNAWNMASCDRQLSILK